MMTLGIKTKQDGIGELNIKICKGTNYIFVRDFKGLSTVESFKELKSGDDVSM